MFQTLLKGPLDEEQAAAMVQQNEALGRLRLGLVAGARLLRDPNDTQQVFYLARAFDHGTLERLRGTLLQTQAGRSLLARRPAIDRASVDFEMLRSLPEHTLGGAYARMLDRNHLTPDVFKRPPGLPDELAWIAQRVRQTHDVWHALTGLDSDVVGEIALQAFTYGQLQLRLSCAIMVFGVVFYGLRYPQVFRLAWRWYREGRKAALLLSVAWEDRWDEPLNQVRRNVGLSCV